MTRISDGLKRVSEANATAYSRAVDAYSRQHGDQLGIGASPWVCAAYLRNRICGFMLPKDPALAALLTLANDEEMAVLRADPLTAQRLDEFLQSLQQEGE